MRSEIRIWFILFFLSSIILPIPASFSGEHEVRLEKSGAYADLITLYHEFRAFQKPEFGQGVPDYSAEAMTGQKNRLKTFQDRLAAIDVSSWPVSQKVDYYLVRSEMKGLEFTHRFLRPWSRDPCFYLPSHGGAGPVMPFDLRLPQDLPMSEKEKNEYQIRLQAVPGIYAQAKKNLTEAAGDLAKLAIWGLKDEIEIYQNLKQKLADYHPEMVKDAELAVRAVESYGEWLKENQSSMTAKAGVGRENYNWWLKNVHLFPYTWEECRDIVMHEDNRVMAFLKLEENRNRDLPPLKPVESQEEYKRSVRKSLADVINFIKDQEIFTVQDYLETEGYFGSWHDFDQPWPEVHDYFFNFSHRESLPEETHECIGHYFDELRQQQDDRPIRGDRRLYNIDWIRSEGFAFGLEELLMHAGYLDDRPQRSREIVYLQAAFRTCRALADLNMHSGEFALEEAMDFAIQCAPRGDLLEGSHHLWYEMETTLRAVGWHMGMVVGKAQFMQLIRDCAKQRGDDFTLRAFMDEFLAAGMIPMSLIRWEMTGDDSEIKELVN